MQYEEVRLLGGKNSYESIKRYEDKAYDKVLVRMPKGKKKLYRPTRSTQDKASMVLSMRP